MGDSDYKEMMAIHEIVPKYTRCEDNTVGG